MRFVCPHGCKNPDGTPAIHAARRFCKYEVAFRRQQGRWARPGEIGGTGEPQPAPTREKKPEGTSKPAPRSGRGISIGYTPAAVVGPGVELKAGQISAEWEISEKTCESFWTTILAGIEQVLDFTCEVLLQIPKVPSEVFVLDDGQKYVIRTTFKGFTTNILQKVFRAKTPEDADRIVAGLGGIVGFGLMGLKIIWHFIKEVPKSPRLAKLRERLAEAKKKRQEAEDERRRAAGENVSPRIQPQVPVAIAGPA